MSNNVANTILEQLGGNKFIAMTGASKFLATDTGLQFCLPRGAHKVVIELTPADTYMMRGYGKLSMKTFEQPLKFLYQCDASELCETFTAATGLAVSL